ncbi:MAG TPA: M28 family peptidase [Anaerolineales bacterium]|nr:M28 family peptidase [Anaerolineales bacterium]
MVDVPTISDAQYAFDLVKAICTEVGPGQPGSMQERQRAAWIQKVLELHLGAENVAVEEFTLAPGAFLGSLPVSALFLLATALLNLAIGRFPWLPPWLTAPAALVLSSLALASFFCEFIRYQEFLDPLFPQTRSDNVIGKLRRPGAQNVTRLLIVSGHHDSAQENTWIGLLGYALFVTVPTILIGLVGMLIMSLIQTAGLITVSAPLLQMGTLGWGMLTFPVIPAVVFAMLFNRGRKEGGTVPGAADNLSACGVVVALARFLAKKPEYIPADTEIRFVSFGSEEAGLLGSRRYVTRHLEELKRLDARLLNYETIAHPEITILTSDVNGVKHAPEMVNSLVAAAHRAGVPFRVAPSPIGGGGNDAGPFSQAGLKASTLLPFKMPQQVVAFYHQKRDRPEILTLEPLLNVLKLSLEWIRCGGEAEEGSGTQPGNHLPVEPLP